MWTPKASTWAAQWHTCSTHKLTPSLKATAVRTASSSRRRPQAVIGKDRNQSHLCGALAARKEAFPCSVDKLYSTVALSDRTPGRSQKDCFPDRIWTYPLDIVLPTLNLQRASKPKGNLSLIHGNENYYNYNNNYYYYYYYIIICIILLTLFASTILPFWCSLERIILQVLARPKY